MGRELGDRGGAGRGWRRVFVGCYAYCVLPTKVVTELLIA